MKRPKSHPTSLSDLVPRVLGELGYDAAGALVDICDCWEAAVGPDVARHCRPTALRGRVLEATVDSSAWCQQLQMRREEILGALAGVLGERAPGELWLRVG